MEDDNKRSVAITSFTERMAREQLAIKRAEKLVKKHELLKEMYENNNRLLLEAREEKRQRELRKNRIEERKQKRIAYRAMRRREKREEESLKEAERVILAKEEKEEKLRKERLRELVEREKEEALAKVKGKKSEKKTKGKVDTDAKAKGPKGPKAKGGKKDKEVKEKTKSIDSDTLRQAFYHNCELIQAVVNEYDAAVRREEVYDDAYWRHIDYFEWGLTSSGTSSDSDHEALNFPLTVTARQDHELKAQQEATLHVQHLKNSLDAKLLSLDTLKCAMLTTKKTYYCHRAEREQREVNRRRRVESLLRNEYDIDVNDLPRTSHVVERFKKMRAQKHETEMKRLEKHIEIIEKLLHEENKKHPRSTRSLPPPAVPRRVSSACDVIDTCDVAEDDVDDVVTEGESNAEIAASLEKILSDVRVEEVAEVVEEEKKEEKKKQGKKGKEKSQVSQTSEGKTGKKPKKGNKSKETVIDLPPPPPPLKRYRASAENLTLELVKNFAVADKLDAKYLSRDKSVTRPLPPETCFSWQPRVVLFKGFHGDQEYSRKVHVSNLRSATRIACRFRRVEYATADDEPPADPLVLQVRPAGELHRVCPGLGFSIDVLFSPLPTTTSFTARLVFVTEREEGVRQFHVPVECTVETCDVTVTPHEVCFPRAPCWTGGRYGVVMRRTVTVVNRGKRACALSIKRVVDDAVEQQVTPPVGDGDPLSEMDYVLDHMDLSVLEDEERCVEYLKNMFECLGDKSGYAVEGQRDQEQMSGKLEKGRKVKSGDNIEDREEPSGNGIEDEVEKSGSIDNDKVDKSGSISISKVYKSGSIVSAKVDKSGSIVSAKIDNKSGSIVSAKVDKSGSIVGSRQEESDNASASKSGNAETWNVSDLHAMLTCKELVDECLNHVFQAFRFDQDMYHVTIPGESTTSLKLRFGTDRPGVYTQTFTLLFHDPGDDSVIGAPVSLPCRAQSTSLPVTLSPAHRDLRTCQTDCDARTAVFCVRNTGKLPCTIRPRLPPALRAHATVTPALMIVQPGGGQVHCQTLRVRFAPLGSILVDAAQYVTGMHALRFPLLVKIQGSTLGKCPALRVYISAVITNAYDLVLHPASVNLGRVSTLETVTSSFQLTNRTLLEQEFGFLDLPTCISVQPGFGFGRIAAGETRSLQLFFSPSPRDMAGNSSMGVPGREGNYDVTIAVTTVAFLGGTHSGDREKIKQQLPAVARTHQLQMPKSVDSLAISEADSSGRSQRMWGGVSSTSNTSSDSWCMEVRDSVTSPSTSSSISVHGLELEGDTRSHLLEILATGGEDNHVTPAEEKHVGLSMRNLCDDVTINGRLASLLDTRALKCEMRVSARVYDPLCELSSTRIILPATPCGSFSVVHLRLRTRTAMRDCLCGLFATRKGDTEGEGFSAKFEWMTPNEEISFAPSQGTMAAGQSIKITIVFRPKLPEEQVGLAARQIKMGRDKNNPQYKRGSSSEEVFDVEPADLFPAEKSLLQVLTPYCTRTTATCVVDIATPTLKRRELLKVELVCPVVRPDLMLMADCPRLQFGPVALGTRPKKHVKLLNISGKHVDVKTSSLNPFGPLFCPVPLVPSLPPEHILVLPVTYAPETLEPVDEYMEVTSGLTVTSLVVTGRGVAPQFAFAPDFAIYRLDTKPAKAVDCKVSIENNCDAPLPFTVALLAVRRATAAKSAEAVVKGDKDKKKGKPAKAAKQVKMAPELSAEDRCELSERFMDFDADYKAGIFVLRDVDKRGGVTVPPFEKRVFSIQFNPPELGEVAGKGGKAKKGKSIPGASVKDVPGGADKKGGNSTVKGSQVASGKDSGKGGKKGKASPASSMKDVSGLPQKFVATFRVVLGDIVEVREMILIGSVQEGKGNK